MPKKKEDSSKKTKRRPKSPPSKPKNRIFKRRTALTSVSPSLDIHSVLVAQKDNRSFSISVELLGASQNKQNVDTTALIDSGAGGSFIDQAYAKKIGATFRPLSRPITAINVDGTKNKRGVITQDRKSTRLNSSH